ncbi:MAG: hypothetical protein ACXQS6_02330 [Candidatus Syntropharchaeales archaeon]|nr:hypothetical protein [Candidatus Syntrophoarchaeum sp.]
MRINVYPTEEGDVLVRLGRMDLKISKEDASLLKSYLDITNWVEVFLTLDQEAKDKFKDEIMVLISKATIDLTRKEKGLAVQFMKGNYSEYTFQNILRLGWRADPKAVKEIVNKYIG